MNSFTQFFSFSETTIIKVVLGTVLLALSTSTVGCYTLLRKRALIGDAIAHAVLPGICLAFLIDGTKNPLTLLIGASITGWLSVWLIDQITSKSRLSEDTATGLVLTTFFAIGTVLLSLIQNMTGLSNQSGLNHYLFGNAVGINWTDLFVFGSLAVIMLSLVMLLYRNFLVVSFDEGYAQSIGLPVTLLRFILTTITVLAVVIGIQTVGVVLMAAMLITPAATARFWTFRLKRMLLISACIGAFSGLFGSYFSYATSSPTGPWIVMTLSIIALITFLSAPQKGIISKLVRERKFKRTINQENILKALFQIGERENSFNQPYSIKSMLHKRPMEPHRLYTGLKQLVKQGYVKEENGKFGFTDQGRKKGQRITKLHRLWELYLTRYVRIAPDHVHDDADTIEHIITPELEKKLEEFMDYPERDPHDSEIPYKWGKEKNEE